MPSLQDELVIKGMRMRNRLALPPLTTNYGTDEGYVTDNIIRFYEKRSRDVGLVIVEATSVRPDGRLVKGSLGLWEDAQVEGMRRLAHTIKNNGSAAVVQLNHAGARCYPTGGKLQGASPSGFAFNPQVQPLVMNQEHIDEMVYDFACAAARAQKAGFDGVEVHGAHFYLISQFLSPLTNQRSDSYGGNARARARFAVQVVKAIKDKLGEDFPVLFRINALENVEGGQSLDDTIAVSKLLAEAGVDILDVSVISQATWKEIDGRRYLLPASAFPKDQPAGANIPPTARIREAVGLPVIGVGKLGQGTVAAESVNKSLIDMAAVGRQMIADPDTAGRLLAGMPEQITPCHERMSCFASIRKGEPLQCKVNKDLP